MKIRQLMLPSLFAATMLGQFQVKAQSKPFEKITSVEGITEYRMPNGLHVLLFPDDSKPTITVNITYLVGSRMEGYGETGMAHLLEHMQFKGSTNHPHIPDELTVHGASPNGTTSYDRTNYFESFVAIDSNLNWALSLEADRMTNSFIAEKDLKSEFSVVRNEFESGENSPSNILEERVLSTMYLWHNYGKSTIGSKEDIEKVPIKNLQAFYKKYYQPDNAVLLVAGKIDPEHTLALINKYFGSIPRPTRVIDPTYTIEPAQDGERHVELRRTGDISSIACAYHICAGSHPDYVAFDVLNMVLTDEPNGRLYQNLVKTGLASNVGGDDPAMKDPGYLYIAADIAKGRSRDSAWTILMSTINNLHTKPVTEEEVEKAKNKLLNGYQEVYRNSGRIGLILSEFIAQGDWRLGFIYRDELKKVTAADVNKVVKEYIMNSNMTSGVFIPTANPERVTVPATPDVAALVKDYKGQAALAAGEAFDPSPANIDKRTERGSIPGGGKYALLSKSTRGGSVEARITLRIGTEKDLENKAEISQLTASMLKRGTATKTMAQINDEFDKLSTTVNIVGNGQNVVITVKSTKENLAGALKLLTDVLRNPAFPEAEFTVLKQESLSDLEQERSEPNAIAFKEFSRVMNPHPKGHFRYIMSVDEEVAAINATTISDLKSFYKNFYNGSNATAAFVGDFDAKVVKEDLDKMLGNWTSPVAFVRVPNVYVNPKAIDQEYKTPDKKNAMYVAGLNLKIRDDNPDYPALLMGNFILGGGFLNSRLATRIRQKEGISYGVGSNIQADALDENGSFFSYAIYNPDNKAKLESAWKEEIARMLKDGFTEDELKQAKSAISQYRQTANAQDAQLAGKLSTYLFLNRTMAWDASVDAKLQNLTVADVNNAMKKYIRLNDVVYIKAGDFK